LRYDRNEHSQAIGALEHAVDDGAADQYWYADAWMYLARAQLKGEQKRAAKGSLTKFLEVAPDDHPSRKEANLQLRKL
jgi:tetratricopeptide (TPR) repeat protein